MKYLEKTFTKGGWKFTLCRDLGKWRCYVKERMGEQNKMITSWEVVCIKVAKGQEVMMKGKKVFFEEQEIYPGDNSWGRLGFSFTNYSDAKAFLLKKVQEEELKEGKLENEELEDDNELEDEELVNEVSEKKKPSQKIKKKIASKKVGRKRKSSEE